MIRISIGERDAWRRPALAAAEETYDERTMTYLDADPRMARQILWLFHDQHQLEDLRRLAHGELCANCLEPMPARPGLATISAFRGVYEGKPDPVGSKWRARVASGSCPVCGTEVSTEFWEALDRGVEQIHPIPEEGS